jgi:hypothetical protein
MKYIDLPKPHGFLIWRQKQKAIASPVPLLSGKLVALISEGEAFGEAVLANPIAVNVKEFERMQDEHCIRPEERKLFWPGVEAFYIHRLTDWQPYAETKSVCVQNGDCEFDELIVPDEAQQALLDMAERLPKTLVLMDNAVVLEGDKAIINEALDSSKIKPVLDATFDGAGNGDTSLSLYQLALVRVPKLQLKKKEVEAVKVSVPLAVFSDEKELSLDRKIGEIREAFYRTFHPEIEREQVDNNHVWLRELYDDYAIVDDAGKLYSVPYINGDKVVFAPSNDWVEVEIAYQPKSMNGSKELDDKIQAAIDKALSSRKWGDGRDSREEVKAEDDAGYLVTGEEGNHLPTKKNGKLDHRLMGAAYAALTVGFRGNKYEGPGKAAALTKLKKLYTSEDMPLPGDGEKAGRRMAGRMVDKLKDMMSLMKDLMGYAAPEDEEDEMEMEGMPEGMMSMMNKGVAIKQVDGKPWLVTYSTNAFKDREKEIFSTKSLEKYVAESEKNNDKGFYNLWHIPNTDFASKEFQMVRGRFLIEAGPFLDNELGQAALKFFESNPDGHKELAPEGWGCSPEYRYLPEERKSGVYENIWITKTSVLPRLAAANIWTKGTIAMTAISEQQEKAAKLIFGEKVATALLSGADDATKELEDANVDHKGDAETPAVVVDVDAVAEALAAKMETRLEPYTDALQVLGQQVAELQTQFKSYQKGQEVKENTEAPRYIFQMKRASEALETAVADGDPLKGMKPVEAVKSTDNSGAANFFPAR